MWTDAARERYRDDGRRTPSDLTDAQWRTVAPVLARYTTLTVDLREMVNACLYLEKAGCPWRFLPKEFGPWQSVRSWHDRFRADGLWTDRAGLPTRAVRAQQGRAPEPTTALMDSQSAVSGPQAGVRGVDGNKRVRGIKRHVLTCSLGFVLAVVVTAANAHDTQPVGALLDRAAEGGWAVERVKVDGIHVGPRVAQAAQDHTVAVQVTTRDPDVKGFKPLPLRWRVEATFGTLSNRWHGLTRNVEQSPAAADAVSIANCHRLLRAYNRPEPWPT